MMSNPDFSEQIREALKKYSKENGIDNYEDLNIDDEALRQYLDKKFSYVNSKSNLYASAKAQIKSLINFSNKGIY